MLNQAHERTPRKMAPVRSGVLLACIACLCLAFAGPTYCLPFQFGSADEDRERAEHDAQRALADLGLSIDIGDADVVKIGSSLAVDEGETIAGDVVIIGGALTVEGTVDGDAVVIGGSMYLASTAVIRGDAVVLGGILETEEGATVKGDVIENPEEDIDIGRDFESGNIVQVEPPEPPEPPEHSEIGYEVESDGDIVKMGKDIYVAEGEVVDGDVVTVGADITVDGTVDGDVVTTSGDIGLGSRARVTGDVVAVFGDVDVADGAIVDGDVVEVSMGGTRLVLKGKDADEQTEKKLREKSWWGVPSLEKQKPGTVRYRISLHVPYAKDVRLTGSFIDWDPDGIRMAVDKEGTWSTYYDFPQGTHLYKFIVDGEAIPDPDVPEKKVDDGMGGYATQIVVIPKTSTAVPIKFSLLRPQAEDVRVTGTFNNWDRDGIKMSQDEDGTWSVTVPIQPGEVLYKFYIDGEWGPDPDVTKRADDGKGGWATPFVVKPRETKFTLKAGETIKEKKGNNFSPGIDYNRVDGLYLAALLSNQTNLFPLPQFYLEAGRSWKRDRWLYTVEIEQPMLPARIVSLGGSFYDKTDSYDKDIISDSENFISSSFVKRDYRDYFDHRGAGAFAAFRPFPHNTFKISYVSDEYRPLYTKAHTAIFRRHDEFAPNPHNPALDDPFDRARENAYQICHDPVTGEKIAGLDKIAIKAMGASYELDTRDCSQRPTSGLLAKFDGEWAGRDFGGDLDYSRYVADLRFYSRFTPNQLCAIRVKAGGMDIPCEPSCPCVPAPQHFFPKQFYVGGIGTMPGYDYKEFRGTHMILLNAEYFLALKGNSGIVFFADGGDARGNGESTSDVLDAMKLKYDAGVGFRVESSDDHIFTIGVAKRLDDTDEPMLVTMRASRPF